jgi:hypothetical protein
MGKFDHWKSVNVGDSWHIEDQKGRVIATIKKSKDAGANARLIAKSPYMLEALQAVVNLIGDEDLPDNGELSGAAVCDLVRDAAMSAGGGGH